MLLDMAKASHSIHSLITDPQRLNLRRALWLHHQTAFLRGEMGTTRLSEFGDAE